MESNSQVVLQYRNKRALARKEQSNIPQETTYFTEIVQITKFDSSSMYLITLQGRSTCEKWSDCKGCSLKISGNTIVAHFYYLYLFANKQFQVQFPKSPQPGLSFFSHSSVHQGEFIGITFQKHLQLQYDLGPLWLVMRSGDYWG